MDDLDPPVATVLPTAPANPGAIEPTRMRARLLDIAELENHQAQRRASRIHDLGRRSELLGAAVPTRYLELVAGLRAAVSDFNTKLLDLPEQPIARLGWYESPNVALRDIVTGDGMRVRVSRGNSSFDLLLRLVTRSGKSDIPIIEGHGSIGRELQRTNTLMRIEGWVEEGRVHFWLSIAFKRLNIPLEEVPDRIVMAVASQDPLLLTRSYSLPHEREKPEVEDEP